jgi:hypothetical protein
MTSRAALALGLLAASVVACVSIPQEVKQTFAPAGPGETSYYRRRPDAPPPEGFVLPAPPPAPGAPPAAPPASTEAPAPPPPPAVDGGVS